MDTPFMVGLVVWYVVFLFSSTLHEASHSFAAALAGDDTAYRAGSATLNPVPHMRREKFGMIIAPIATYFLNGGNWMIGWASAPFNPYWAARHPRRSFAMSLAGPLSHLLPLTAAWLAMMIGLKTGYFAPDPLAHWTHQPVTGVGAGSFSWSLAMFLNVVFMLNTVLLTFNLMPLPPLDGSEIWYLLMKKEETRLKWRYTANSYAFVGILLAWHYFPPFYRFVVGRLINLLLRFGHSGP